MIVAKPETLVAIKEKLDQVLRERRSLSAADYRLPWRGNLRRNNRPYTPEVWDRIQARFKRYVSEAAMRGKDVSTYRKRQPYLMVAIREELSTKEKKLETRRKRRRTMAQRSYYYMTKSREARQRMKGELNVQGSHDRA